jgi:serine/threonine protein kinase
MGVVVAAHHIQLDERVALKFLLPDALDNSDAVRPVRREARAAVKIKSEHVARVSDVGTLPNGAPYMVMEYLDGGDLAAWLQERGTLPIEQASSSSSKRARPSPRRTLWGSCTGTSSPPTCSASRSADGSPFDQGPRLRHLEDDPVRELRTERHHLTPAHSWARRFTCPPSR